MVKSQNIFNGWELDIQSGGDRKTIFGMVMGLGGEVNRLNRDALSYTKLQKCEA